MPYNIVKRKSGFLVTKKSTGQVIGRHASRRKAQAQIAAIYANENKKKPH